MPEQRWRRLRVVAELNRGTNIGRSPRMLNDRNRNAVERWKMMHLPEDFEQYQQAQPGRSPLVERRAHSSSSGCGV
jgi:hypothetical protein